MKLTRKTTIFLALLLALVSIGTAVTPTLATPDEPSADASGPYLRDGLALVAPVVARPDQPVTMTVFKWSDQTPMEGAGVWAFTNETAPLFDAEIARLRDASQGASPDTDWESIVSVYGRFIGRTDARGKLTTTFSEGSCCLLVAVKAGYLPGRTGIGIAVTPDALGIRAPEQADVNAPVIISVYEKASSEPVEGPVSGPSTVSRQKTSRVISRAFAKPARPSMPRRTGSRCWPSAMCSSAAPVTPAI
jgi:hypothetical protein